MPKRQTDRQQLDTATTGIEWRRQRTESYIVPLPSGNIARLRSVALDVMISSGELPDILTPIAAKALWTETDAETFTEQVEAAKGFVALVNKVIPSAMVEPKIVESPRADDEIGIDDLDFNDKIAIFQLATGPTALLRNFRDQQVKRLAALSNGHQNGDPPQQASEDPPLAN